jgi:hypothetical protein
LSKKNNAKSITLLDFEIDYKADVIKTRWPWHKVGHIVQQNRTENPGINPSISIS